MIPCAAAITRVLACALCARMCAHMHVIRSTLWAAGAASSKASAKVSATSDASGVSGVALDNIRSRPELRHLSAQLRGAEPPMEIGPVRSEDTDRRSRAGLLQPAQFIGATAGDKAS